MSEIDTPPQLSKPPDDVSPWLAYYIGQIHNAVKTIGKTQTGILSRLIAVEKSVNNKPKNNPASTPVTFKWIADWGMKAVFLFVGGAATVIFKLVYDALIN